MIIGEGFVGSFMGDSLKGFQKNHSVCLVLLSEGGQQGQWVPKVSGPYGFLVATGDRATAYFCPWIHGVAL